MENIENTNQNDGLEPSFKWLFMEKDKLFKAMNKYVKSKSRLETSLEVKSFHHMLLNLLVKDDTLIHAGWDGYQTLERKYQTPVVECLKILYEDTKDWDYEVHQILLQNQWIKTVLKPKSDAWDNPTDRLFNLELPFAEYADLVLEQDVLNTHLDNFFPQLGRDILDWQTNNKLNSANIEERKLKVLYSIVRHLATTNVKSEFTTNEIRQFRALFVANTNFKRPSTEFLMDAAKKMCPETAKP